MADHEDGAGGTPLSGADLRRLRLRAGLSERELASQISYSASQVSCWERGQCAIPLSVLPVLRQVLATRLAALQAEREAWAALRSTYGVGAVTIPRLPVLRHGASPNGHA